MQAALTQGVHHLGLTVRDCQTAAAFFVDVLGFSRVKERPDYPAVFVSDGAVLLTLWQAQSKDPAVFDRKGNLGLHHFALRLADAQSLDLLHERLVSRPDVKVEFAPESLGGSQTRHLMCVFDDAFRLELIAPIG